MKLETIVRHRREMLHENHEAVKLFEGNDDFPLNFLPLFYCFVHFEYFDV